MRIACGLQPSLQLSTAWKDQRSAAAAIPEDLVREAVQRAEKELTARAQFEYRMWADSEYCNHVAHRPARHGRRRQPF